MDRQLARPDGIRNRFCAHLDRGGRYNVREDLISSKTFDSLTSRWLGLPARLACKPSRGFLTHVGVAFNQSGNLFVATATFDGTTFQGAIVKITPDGVQRTIATLSEQNFEPEGVAFDLAGNLFVMAIDDSDPNFASTIFKFTPGGVQSTFGSVPGAGFGLAFDSAGNLFAADAGSQTIWKFTPDGTRSVFVHPSPNAFQGPAGLAFDRFGNLFASIETFYFGSENDGILKFTPNGVQSTFATGLGNFPRGLAFDRAGNLFVAEVGESQNPSAPGDILKFTPDGVGTVFAQNIVPGGNDSGPEFLAFLPPRP